MKDLSAYKKLIRELDAVSAQDNLISSYEIWANEQGLTQAEAASLIDVSLPTYKRLIAREGAKIDFMSAMKISTLLKEPLKSLCGYEIKDYEIYQKLQFLQPRERRFISALVDFDITYQKYLDTYSNDSDDISVLIPTGNLEDGMILDAFSVEKIDISPLRGKSYYDSIDCGIKVTSNHYHPAYNVGDTLLISRTAPRSGDVGIFIDVESGRTYIRKFEENQDYCMLRPIHGFKSELTYGIEGKAFKVKRNDLSDLGKWVKFGVVLTKI